MVWYIFIPDKSFATEGQSVTSTFSPHFWLTLSSSPSHQNNYLILCTHHFWSIPSIGLVPAPAVGGLAGNSIEIWITSTHNHQCQLLNMRQFFIEGKSGDYSLWLISCLMFCYLTHPIEPRKYLLEPINI